MAKRKPRGRGGQRPPRNHKGPVVDTAHLFDERTDGSREKIWFWLSLYNKDFQLDPATCARSSMGDEIARAIRGNPLITNVLARKLDRCLLPLANFQWITDDERQLAWLHPRVEQITDSRIPRATRHLIGKDRIIAMIDIWDENLDVKAEEIEGLNREWKRHISQDSKFEWFMDKKEGEKRCACAWEWIEKNIPRLPFRQDPISNYSELLQYFDKSEHGHHEQKAIIQEIKKRWSRKQFDERNADKTQINVLLSKDVVAQLDRLVKERGTKRPQFFEQLILQEAQNSLTKGT